MCLPAKVPTPDPPREEPGKAPPQVRRHRPLKRIAGVGPAHCRDLLGGVNGRPEVGVLPLEKRGGTHAMSNRCHRPLSVLRAVILMSGLPLMVSLVQAAQVQVSWTAPTTNANGSPLTDLGGYRVHYGTCAGQYSTTLDAGIATQVVIAGLARGKPTISPSPPMTRPRTKAPTPPKWPIPSQSLQGIRPRRRWAALCRKRRDQR